MTNLSSRASGMTVAPKPFHEPDENEAQIAALLDGHIDTLDHALERALHYGLEAKVREIVAKHLPPPPAPTPPATAPSPPVADATPPTPGAPSPGLKGLSAAQVNTVLGLFNCVQVLDEHVRRAKADSPSGKRAATCRDFLRGEIEKLKRGEA